MTEEQWGVHEDYKAIIGRLMSKWKRYKFLRND